MSKITVSEIESPSNSPIIISSGINFDIPIRIKNYTTAEINALSGNVSGDLVYDSTVDLLKIFNGSDWDEVGGLPNAFDVINEESVGTGVTVDGVLHKDNQVYTDTINELTDQAGVEVDGVLLKDRTISADVINEKITNTGVTIEGTLLKDSTITAAGNILADQDTTHDIGSTTEKFNKIWLGTGLDIGGNTVGFVGTDITVDGGFATDTLKEKTAAAGITIPSDVIFTGDIDATGAGTITGMPTGKLGQFEFTFSDTEATYAAPNADPGVELAALTTTITPTQGNSKILIMLNLFGEAGHHDMVGYVTRTVQGVAEVALKPTTITGQRGSFHVGWYNDTNYDSTPHTTHYHMIDSPATTNLVTYKVYLAKTSGGTTNFQFNGTINTTTSLNYEKGHSTLTLMELLV